MTQEKTFSKFDWSTCPWCESQLISRDSDYSYGCSNIECGIRWTSEVLANMQDGIVERGETFLLVKQEGIPHCNVMHGKLPGVEDLPPDNSLLMTTDPDKLYAGADALLAKHSQEQPWEDILAEQLCTCGHIAVAHRRPGLDSQEALGARGSKLSSTVKPGPCLGDYVKGEWLPCECTEFDDAGVVRGQEPGLPGAKMTSIREDNRVVKLEFVIEPDGELIWNEASHDFTISQHTVSRKVNGQSREEVPSLSFFPKLCSSICDCGCIPSQQRSLLMGEPEEKELDDHSIIRALAREKAIRITIEVLDSASEAHVNDLRLRLAQAEQGNERYRIQVHEQQEQIAKYERTILKMATGEDQ